MGFSIISLRRLAKYGTGIVPLTEENYPTWKVQCKMCLMKDGLRGIVDGSERAPGMSDNTYSKFISRRDRTLATIVLSIDPSLVDPTEPTAVWEKLSTQFQKKT